MRAITFLIICFAMWLMPLAVASLEEGQEGTDRPPELAGVETFSAPLDEGADVIGIRPEGWNVRDWMNSEPLALEALRGKVVLVRWWTAPGCVFCQASAPALNDFWKRYRSRGLVVVGLYHHKSSEPLRLADVKKQSGKLGFEFPVAIDPDWKTLNRWWLDKHERGWTSVTFLLDRRGVIRHVHPGGAFFKGEPGYDVLEKKIEALLAEQYEVSKIPPPRSSSVTSLPSSPFSGKPGVRNATIRDEDPLTTKNGDET